MEKTSPLNTPIIPLPKQSLTILGFKYSHAIVFDKIFDCFDYHVQNYMESSSSQTYISIFGFDFECEVFSRDMEVILKYNGDIIFDLDYDISTLRNESLYELTSFVIETLVNSRKKQCIECGHIFCTRSISSQHCNFCKETLNCTSNQVIDSIKDDNCTICMEMLGDYNVATFKCGFHVGHIKCISTYNRHCSKKEDERYACPYRCQCKCDSDEDSGDSDESSTHSLTE